MLEDRVLAFVLPDKMSLISTFCVASYGIRSLQYVNMMIMVV